MLRDKSAHDFLAEFDAPQFDITLTQAPSHRALTTDEIQEVAGLQHAQMTVQPDLEAAINQGLESKNAFMVITGSLRIAALAREVLGLLNKAELEESQMTRAIFEGKDYLAKLG
jgi:folylpolyglutamate synthase/dihydropteroate synthase